MAIQMNVAEAKAKLSELIARAEAGEEVIIARDGKPAVVLKPAGRAGNVRIGGLAHLGPAWEAPDAWAPMSDEDIADVEGAGDEESLDSAPR